METDGFLKQMRLAIDQVMSLLSCGDPFGDENFLVAYAVLFFGERHQRVAVMRKTARKTRNIELQVDFTSNYLLLGVDVVLAKTRRKKERRIMEEKLIERLSTAIKPIREGLGLGSAQPQEFSYQITEDVVAATANDTLQKHLRTLVTKGALSESRLEDIHDFLQRDFPKEALAVMSALEATKSREHVSAISLLSGESGTLVTIVNDQGQILTFQDYKFLDLIESPGGGRRLHEFRWQDRKDSADEFIFNDNQKGVIVGKLSAEMCVLSVVCVQDDQSICDLSRFNLDLDYLCCVYLVLKRIRDDRVRFNLLREKAESTIDYDPFKTLLDPLTF
jgi:hypothetical protein